jgi:PPM family protein phosphatase
MANNIIIDSLSDAGGRTFNEDRAEAVYLDAKKLHVAIVADGVGGEEVGYVAAQTAIDSLLENLNNSTETDIPSLLKESVRVANHAVIQAMKSRGGATTLAVAVIYDKKTLYLANVGDSRVYLCRNGELIQLTIDHTFANVIPWQGEMSAEAARLNPQAEDLVYVLGRKEQVPVDIGFYGNNTTDRKIAQARGLKGLTLQEGDSILVCSDGLIKNSPKSNEPFTKPEEIVKVLTTQEGRRAAGSLVAFALGREATDNVSVAILQLPDPLRSKRTQRPLKVAGGIIAGLVVLIAIVVYLAFNRIDTIAQEVSLTQTAEAITVGQQVGSLAATLTRSVFEQSFNATAIAATQTAQPTATPTPTPIPRDPLPLDKIGERLDLASDQLIPIAENEDLRAGEFPFYLRIRQDEEAQNDADIYAGSDSHLRFTSVSGDRMLFLLFAGSSVFVRTGGYVGGITATIPEAASLLQFSVAGSCMSIEHPIDSNEIVVNCFEGVCSYSIAASIPADIAPGSQVIFDRQNLTVVSTSRLSAGHAVEYQRELEKFGVRNISCLAAYVPPTPTPTLIPIIIPTYTPTPTNSSSQPSTKTPPPVPPTNTPVPPTNTPVPPTNTPTSTPVPPTNTPTSTPVPPRPTATPTQGP